MRSASSGRRLQQTSLWKVEYRVVAVTATHIIYFYVVHKMWLLNLMNERISKIKYSNFYTLVKFYGAMRIFTLYKQDRGIKKLHSSFLASLFFSIFRMYLPSERLYEGAKLVCQVTPKFLHAESKEMNFWSTKALLKKNN